MKWRRAQVDPAFFTSVFDYIEQFMDRSVTTPRKTTFLFRLLRQRSLRPAPCSTACRPSTATARKTCAALRDKTGVDRRWRVGNRRFCRGLRSYTQA
jgi:branched-chain amino acid transport system ATP-binding protein